MRNSLLAAFTAFAFWIAVPAIAQDDSESRPRRDRGEAVQGILDLSELQVQQLKDLNQAHRENVRGLMTQARELGGQRRELLESDSPDPTQLGSLLIQQQGLRQQLEETNNARHEAALALLTETQREKVAEIQEARRLAPMAGPLAGFGLLERPERGEGGPGMRNFRRRSGRRGGPGPAAGGARFLGPPARL